MPEQVKFYQDPYAIGSVEFFRLNPLMDWAIATEGVVGMCNKLSCFWLFDAFMSHIPGIRKRHPEAFTMGFLVGKLILNETGNGARLTIDDGNGNVLAVQPIPYTDIPENVQLFIQNNGQGWTAMLPSEY